MGASISYTVIILCVRWSIYRILLINAESQFVLELVRARTYLLSAANQDSTGLELREARKSLISCLERASFFVSRLGSLAFSYDPDFRRENNRRFDGFAGHIKGLRTKVIGGKVGWQNELEQEMFQSINIFH